MNSLKKIVIALLLLHSISSFGLGNQKPLPSIISPQIALPISLDDQNPPLLIIPPQVALPIGIKIWFNESGGSVMGLTHWNDGENFASLGIGHFIWHPYPSKKASTNSGFPSLLSYLETRGVNIPYWLRGKNGLHCPWHTRAEFLEATYSKKMIELRAFLQHTIPIQAEYMARHLQEILPDLLESTPKEDQSYIYERFHQLASTPSGIYAMVDYLNFKGAGAAKSRYNYVHGTGLLQVIKGMRNAPPNYTLLQSYVWSAKHALIKRVERSSSSQHTERWLAGWFKRLNTYLEGDFETKIITN
ncbi:MAG: hypothetical protein KKE11_06660 [Gammaproteobacteria bacterium]|nr:hypothetical protein [Gammaproteobacteria bacterium]